MIRECDSKCDADKALPPVSASAADDNDDDAVAIAACAVVAETSLSTSPANVGFGVDCVVDVAAALVAASPAELAPLRYSTSP